MNLQTCRIACGSPAILAPTLRELAVTEFIEAATERLAVLFSPSQNGNVGEIKDYFLGLPPSSFSCVQIFLLHSPFLQVLPKSADKADIRSKELFCCFPAESF